jgi:hypothetical protein
MERNEQYPRRLAGLRAVYPEFAKKFWSPMITKALSLFGQALLTEIVIMERNQ